MAAKKIWKRGEGSSFLKDKGNFQFIFKKNGFLTIAQTIAQKMPHFLKFFLQIFHFTFMC
jgi:hypothetical protein